MMSSVAKAFLRSKNKLISSGGTCGLLVAGCIGLAGCASVNPTVLLESSQQPPIFQNKNLSLESAAASLQTLATSGRNASQPEVTNLLGKATSKVRFDNGYEIWVYRNASIKAPASGTELVLLFAPDGLLKKYRVRPA